MKKCYAYSKFHVIGNYGLLFVAFFILSVFTLKGMGVPKKETLGFFIGAAITGIGPCLAVLVWIFITLKIRIYIDDDGIEYISLFKKVRMKWQNIVSIETKSIYSRAVPKDLEIKDRHNQMIRVFYFVEDCAKLLVEGGMEDFEGEIKKRRGNEGSETRTAAGSPIIKYTEQ
jgi:hypothetical protein